MIVVHHTALWEGHPLHGATLVREIQALHMRANGWDDVGYNLLVDRLGRAYEGRAGGLERAVVGAHAQGVNRRSAGIAVIGDFSGQPPPARALEALVRLLAWKLALHGLPATDETIVGHHELGETECPGSALAALLPDLRRRAAEPIAGH